MRERERDFLSYEERNKKISFSSLVEPRPHPTDIKFEPEIKNPPHEPHSRWGSNIPRVGNSGRGSSWTRVLSVGRSISYWNYMVGQIFRLVHLSYELDASSGSDRSRRRYYHPSTCIKKNGEGECLAGSYWAEAKFWPIGPEAARPMMTLGNRNVLLSVNQCTR